LGADEATLFTAAADRARRQTASRGNVFVVHVAAGRSRRVAYRQQTNRPVGNEV
jgi:hypothetical protein